jgi:DNA-binding NtrC family response regulator
METSDTIKTVLVVDDYEPICELIQLLLVQVRYEVHFATTGRGALQIAQTVPQIHLTVCGIGLQDMPAEECVEECAKCHPDAAVLFMANAPELIRSSRSFTVIEKPFSITRLRTAVHSAVGPAFPTRCG